MKTSDSTLLSTPQSILLMGPPGGGKTTFALQWPGLFVLNADDNLAGPIRWLQQQKLYKPFFYQTIGMDNNGPITDPAKHWDNAKMVLTEVVRNPEIKTIFVDSLTHLDQILQQWIMRRQKKTNIEVGDWNIFKHELYTVIMAIKASGKTVLMACHEKIEYGSDFKIERYIPAVSTNIKDYFGYIFSDVWRCTIKPDGGKNLKATVSTHPTALSDLKNSLLFEKGEIEARYEVVAERIGKV